MSMYFVNIILNLEKYIEKINNYGIIPTIFLIQKYFFLCVRQI